MVWSTICVLICLFYLIAGPLVIHRHIQPLLSEKIRRDMTITEMRIELLHVGHIRADAYKTMILDYCCMCFDRLKFKRPAKHVSPSFSAFDKATMDTLESHGDVFGLREGRHIFYEIFYVARRFLSVGVFVALEGDEDMQLYARVIAGCIMCFVWRIEFQASFFSDPFMGFDGQFFHPVKHRSTWNQRFPPLYLASFSALTILCISVYCTQRLMNYSPNVLWKNELLYFSYALALLPLALHAIGTIGRYHEFNAMKHLYFRDVEIAKKEKVEYDDSSDEELDEYDNNLYKYRRSITTKAVQVMKLSINEIELQSRDKVPQLAAGEENLKVRKTSLSAAILDKKAGIVHQRQTRGSVIDWSSYSRK
jgi:hypothetical protein